MKTLPLLRALTLAVLLPCLAVFAADPPKPAKKETKAAETAKTDNPWQRKLAQVQFENLALSEVVNYLSDDSQFPEINFLVDPSIKELPISLKLRSVTLDDIFTAMGVCSQDTLQVNKMDEHMVSLTQRKEEITESRKPICRVFTLSRYLAGKSDKEVDVAMRDVEEALRLCWDMLKADQNNRVEPPRLNLHRGTKLLIVVGQESQVSVVMEVINQLEQGTNASAPMIDPSTGLPIGFGAGPGPFGARVPGEGGFPSTPKVPGAR